MFCYRVSSPVHWIYTPEESRCILTAISAGATCPAVLLLISFIFVRHIHCPFLSTCVNLADDTKTKSKVVAHCLVVAGAMLHCMCFSIVLCRHASRQRRRWGGKPATGPTGLSGCGCVPHTGWFFFKLFRKTFFDAEIEAHVYFCGSLSSGRASRGRLARFLDVCPSVCVFLL